MVFVQYLTSLAIVEGIKSYGMGYSSLPIKLKWPNDICKMDDTSGWLGRRPADDSIPDAEDPTKPGQQAYVKIAGILVNSTFYEKEYLLVVGTCVCAFKLAF